MKEQAAIFFGGNVNVGRRMNFNPHEKPFGNIAAMIEADLRIVNLDCVIAAQGQQIHKGEGDIHHLHARPEQINLLIDANIDVALTANNHALDYDVAALSEQNAYLEQAGILHCGTGKNFDDAARPLFIKVNDIIIALFNVDATMNFFAATEDKPGTFYLPPDKPERWKNFFAEKIADAKRKADVVFVAPHWSPKGLTEPIEPIKILGRLLIDCGADAVLGCHPHLVQGVETYKNRPIIYSPGNFLFDAIPRLGGAFLIVVSKSGVEQIVFNPLIIEPCKISSPNVEQTAQVDMYFIDACQKLNTTCGTLPGGLIEIKFEPPPREDKELEPVELSTSLRTVEKISPLTEPLPEWIVDDVPEDSRIEPQQFGAIKLVGCRIAPECLPLKKFQTLYVETYWTLDESTAKDLKIQILGVPTVEGAIPNFGVDLEHQACDWMFPTNRWKAGVIYREKFGLPSPFVKDVANVNLRAEISVFDDTTALGKYIHPTTITLQPSKPVQIPAQVPKPSTPAKIPQPSAPAKIPKSPATADIEIFKREFDTENNVVVFMLNKISSDSMSRERSACRRAKLFEKYLGVKVTLVTNDWQNDSSTQRDNCGIDSPILNMYDYFQEIDREIEQPREISLQPLHEDWKVKFSGDELKICQANDTLIMQCAYFPKSHKLSRIDFRNDDRKIYRRDFYDSLGFLSCRQELAAETQRVKEIFYYRPDGTVAVHELYEVNDSENKLSLIELIDREENVTRSFNNREDAVSHWLSKIFNDATKNFFLISDGTTIYDKYLQTSTRGNVYKIHIANENSTALETKCKYDAIITSTENQRNDIVTRYELENVFAIPNSLVAALKVKNFEPNPFKIVQVGRLADFKSYAAAVDVMRRVLKKFPQATLHFHCEKNPLQAEVQKLIDANNLGDNIKFADFNDNPHEIFSSAALSIFTGNFEGFSCAIQESLLQDCPVVAFDCCCGAREMTADGVNGYLVPVDDASAMAERIIKIFTVPGLRQRLAANCARSIEKFSPKVVANHGAKLFNGLMNSDSTGMKKSARQVAAIQDAKIFNGLMNLPSTGVGKFVSELTAPELSAPEVAASHWDKIFKQRKISRSQSVKKSVPKISAPKVSAPEKSASEAVANQWVKLFTQFMN